MSDTWEQTLAQLTQYPAMLTAWLAATIKYEIDHETIYLLVMKGN